MDTNVTKRPMGFAKGQLWQVEDAYIQIVELENSLIHYKMMQHPGQKAALTRLIRLEAFAVYLRATGAVPMDLDQVAA